MAAIKRAFHDITEWFGEWVHHRKAGEDALVDESYVEYEHTIEQAKISAYMNRRLFM